MHGGQKLHVLNECMLAFCKRFALLFVGFTRVPNGNCLLICLAVKLFHDSTHGQQGVDSGTSATVYARPFQVNPSYMLLDGGLVSQPQGLLSSGQVWCCQ